MHGLMYHSQMLSQIKKKTIVCNTYLLTPNYTKLHSVTIIAQKVQKIGEVDFWPFALPFNIISWPMWCPLGWYQDKNLGSIFKDQRRARKKVSRNGANNFFGKL